jgi:para-nitrobenzyl esterase
MVSAEGMFAFMSSRQSSVVTKSGPIQGLRENGVYAYKGIPYAKAPVGDLRFAPPQDVEPWTEVRDCTEYGPIAVQRPTIAMLLDNSEQSEDCLTLNIWTPSAPEQADKLPVYVFIHGGGYGVWTGNDKTFAGVSFAKNGVVAVTINYRLSTLGFFASEETYQQYGTTGNWGLLDQIKALEWVRDNIAAFGGDPDQVTIGGESAGSWSVSALILSPLAKGLFRSAILQSGTILSVQSASPYRGDLRESIEESRVLAGIFGASDSAEGLEQLRQVDAHALNYLSPFIADQSGIMPAFFMMPTFDGYVLPKDPAAALRAGDYNKVDLLIGFNRDEGTLFIQSAVDSSFYESFAARTIGKKWRSFMEHFPVNEQNNATQRTRQLLAYTWFSAGEKLFADTFVPHNKVFMYNYNFVAPNNPRSVLGAYHSSELPYAFNTIGIRDLSGAENEKLAQEMHLRWVNFIKTGDPNSGAKLPTPTQWPQYDTAQSQVLFLDNDITAGALPDKDNLDFTAELLYGVDD